MIVRNTGASTLLLFAIAGCSAGVVPPPWTPDLAQEVRRTADANPAAQESEGWLLEAALAHSRPGTPEYDPERASDHFVSLLEHHPDTRHRVLASYLLPLLAEEARQRQRVERLTGDAERLRQQLDEAYARIDGLNQLLDSLEARDGSYRETIETLQATVRTRTRQVRDLEEKLNALMRVDLESRP